LFSTPTLGGNTALAWNGTDGWSRVPIPATND
jgi:hypothetical protein